MAANLASLQYNREEEIREGRAAQHGDVQYDEFGFERRSPNYDEYEEYLPDENDEERESWGRNQYKPVPMHAHKEERAYETQYQTPTSAANQRVVGSNGLSYNIVGAQR